LFAPGSEKRVTPTEVRDLKGAKGKKKKKKASGGKRWERTKGEFILNKKKIPENPNQRKLKAGSKIRNNVSTIIQRAE